LFDLVSNKNKTTIYPLTTTTITNNKIKILNEKLFFLFGAKEDENPFLNDK